MNIDKNIQKELIEMDSLLKDVLNRNVYAVPTNYFDRLSSNILEKINSGVEPVYYFSASMPFFVPDGYFKNLSQAILSKINKGEVFEELELIAPLLNTINKSTVYGVPDNFFSGANYMVSHTTEAKVVQLKKTNKMIRFWAAAVVVTLALVSTFLITNKNNTSSASHVYNAAAELKSLSEEEIIRFLKTSSPIENVTSASLNTTSLGKDLNKSLKEMSDQEIQEFLQETREPGGI